MNAMTIPTLEPPCMEKKSRVAPFAELTVSTRDHVAGNFRTAVFNRGEPGEMVSKPAGLVPWGRCEDGKPVGGVEKSCFHRYQFFKINFVPGWPNPSPGQN